MAENQTCNKLEYRVHRFRWIPFDRSDKSSRALSSYLEYMRLSLFSSMNKEYSKHLIVVMMGIEPLSQRIY